MHVERATFREKALINAFSTTTPLPKYSSEEMWGLWAQTLNRKHESLNLNPSLGLGTLASSVGFGVGESEVFVVTAEGKYGEDAWDCRKDACPSRYNHPSLSPKP